MVMHMQNVICFNISTVCDTDNLHFSADMPHRFSEGSHAAMRESFADLYNAEDVRG